MSSITINATMEVIYYAVGVIGSIRIVKDLFKPKEKIDISSSEGFSISFKDLIKFK